MAMAAIAIILAAFQFCGFTLRAFKAVDESTAFNTSFTDKDRILELEETAVQIRLCLARIEGPAARKGRQDVDAVLAAVDRLIKRQRQSRWLLYPFFRFKYGASKLDKLEDNMVKSQSSASLILLEKIYRASLAQQSRVEAAIELPPKKSSVRSSNQTQQASSTPKEGHTTRDASRSRTRTSAGSALSERVSQRTDRVSETFDVGQANRMQPAARATIQLLPEVESPGQSACPEPQSTSPNRVEVPCPGSRLIAALAYDGMKACQTTATEQHDASLTWHLLLEDNVYRGATWISLYSWLHDGSGFYWIHGKEPTSRRNLLDLIIHDKKTTQALSVWAKAQTVIITHCFQLNGFELQKNMLGLLRSSICQLLGHRRAIVDEDRLGNEPCGLYLKELSELLLRLCRKRNFKVCFLIDGLDYLSDAFWYFLACFEHLMRETKGRVKCVISSSIELHDKHNRGQYAGLRFPK